MIPKIIHQTWKNKNIPEKWKDAVDSCKQLNPDFQHIVWTDKEMEQFVKEEYPDFYVTYKSYKYHIQRCDAFRYLVLNTYGGIYLDMDIVCNKKLTKLLHYDLVIAPSISVNNIFTNSFFMAIPGHPFLGYCIDKLSQYKNTYQYFGKHLHVMNSTGPLFITNRFNECNKFKNMYILTYKEFAGDCNICNELVCKGGTYFTHIKGDSWHEIDSTMYNFVLCNKNKIFGTMLIGSGIFMFLK